MRVEKKKLSGLYEVISEPCIDERGMLVRMYDEKEFKSLSLNTVWVQESYSRTDKKGTLRGIHVQFPPFTEAKLIRMIRGRMLWVVVDLRKNSETFGLWESCELLGAKTSCIYVERGFGHGCVSLSDGCDMVIMSDNYYSNEHGAGITWNDKELNIDWHLEGITPVISENHKSYPPFSEFCEKYGGVEIQ